MGMHKSLVKLVDPTDPVFRELHNFTECRYQKFHGKGIGATQRQAESISKEEQGLFGEHYTTSSLSISHTAFCFLYYGLYFVLS